MDQTQTNQHLDDEDIKKIEKLNPLIDLINSKTDVFYWIGGGAVRDCFNGDAPRDFDLWFKSNKDSSKFITDVLGVRSDFFKTKTSSSFNFYDFYLQVIFRDGLVFKNVTDLINSFDIRACCMAYDRDKVFTAMDGHSIESATEKRIEFWDKSRPANGIARIVKFLQRGWTVDEEEVKELLMELHFNKGSGYDFFSDFYTS